MTSLKQKLIELEAKADLINGDHGNLYEYCLYYGTTEYNGKVGLVHTSKCVITQLRNLIKEVKQE